MFYYILYSCPCSIACVMVRIQSDDNMNMYDLCMNYMKPSDKSIDNTQVYNCGQLVAPLWWLNWPPRTISSGYLGRPQRWPLLPLSSTNISTTQEVSQIGKWAAGCRRRHLHLPTFAPLQLLFCLTRRPDPGPRCFPPPYHRVICIPPVTSRLPGPNTRVKPRHS